MSKARIRYTVMPDFGGAYLWVNSTDDDFLSSKHPGDSQSCGDVVSPELEAAFVAWQAVFERGRHDFLDSGEVIDWAKFNATGLALSRLLKAEVGEAARVFYQRPREDPEYSNLQRREILHDGSSIHWPKIYRPRPIKNAPFPEVIISGGQTGVDRAALDWAIAKGISHSGWCPLGRRANDGVLPETYLLVETQSRGYPERTRKNVEMATTTLVLIEGALVGGSLLTVKLAEQLGARYGVFPLDSPAAAELANGIGGWLAAEDCTRLNIAGPSEERCPGIHQRVMALLHQVFPA